jgi:integrase
LGPYCPPLCFRPGQLRVVGNEAGIGDRWTPRELRTSFVSLMSHRGVSIEEIARLVGHASTHTTEIAYRRELRPVITTGAEIMDELFTGT